MVHSDGCQCQDHELATSLQWLVPEFGGDSWDPPTHIREWLEGWYTHQREHCPYWRRMEERIDLGYIREWDPLCEETDFQWSCPIKGQRYRHHVVVKLYNEWYYQDIKNWWVKRSGEPPCPTRSGMILTPLYYRKLYTMQCSLTRQRLCQCGRRGAMTQGGGIQIMPGDCRHYCLPFG